MKKTVIERVNEYLKKHPIPDEYDMSLPELMLIKSSGDWVDMIITSFSYGYMMGETARKAGAK